MDTQRIVHCLMESLLHDSLGCRGGSAAEEPRQASRNVQAAPRARVRATGLSRPARLARLLAPRPRELARLRVRSAHTLGDLTVVQRHDAAAQTD